MAAQPGGKSGLRLLFLTLALLIAGFVALVRFAYSTPQPGGEISLDYVYTLARVGLIREATLLDQDAQVVGKRCLPVAGQAFSPQVPDDPSLDPGTGLEQQAPAECDKTRTFHASYPQSDVATQQLIEVFTASNTKLVVDKQSSTAIAKLLITFVFPLAMLANLFGIIFMWKGGESSIADIAGFGKLGKKRQREKHAVSQVTFANVAGADESVAEMREVIEYLTNPKKFEEFGAAPPKGVLLFGPPGCGKTLLARATAGESKVPFFSASGTEFVESLVGVGAARVRDLFSQLREAAPAILFIDEIDAVGRRRTGEGASGGEREQTLNQLLVEMDGFEVSSGIVVMGATNRPDILDPALTRPGRFDRHVTLLPPDVNGRRAILELHGKKRPLSSDVDFDLLARRTPGFTGADLANVINEAGLLAIRELNADSKKGESTDRPSSVKITPEHLTEAIQRVLHGPQRRGTILTPEERRRLSYHESAHALVATALSHPGEVQRISIVARGRGLGQSVVADSDRALLTLPEMQVALAVAISGTAAEKLIFGHASTTAEDDIQRATILARQMIGLYGMSAKVGMLHLISRSEGFVGGDSTSPETMSTATMAEFDLEAKRLIEAGEHAAIVALEENRSALDTMAEELETQETIEGEALDYLLATVKHIEIISSPNGRPPVSKSRAGTTRRPGTRA